MKQRRPPSAESPSPGTNSSALARIEKKQGGEKRSATKTIVTLIKNWKPRTTPKLTFSLILYVVGLFLAFFARPLPVTPEQFEKYEQKLRLIDSDDGLVADRLEAEDAYRSTRMELYERQRFGWRWRGRFEKLIIQELKRKERKQWRALKALNKERERKLRDARSELGIWSEEGVREAKNKFWEKYEGGKVFATEQTFYDAFNALLNGRSDGKSDDKALEFMIRWTFRILINFTIGMFGAIVGFIFALPSVIHGFGASFFSFVFFFILAVITAISVVLTFLGLLYGGAIGGIVGIVKVASKNALRLEAKKKEEMKRLQERQQRQEGRNVEEKFSDLGGDNRDHMD